MRKFTLPSFSRFRSLTALPLLIWLVWLAIFLDTLLYTGVLPLLNEIGESESLNDGRLGLILAAYSFAGVFACLPFGIINDRWKPRLILVGSVVGISLGGLLVAAYPTPVGISVGRMVQGLSSAALWTSGMAVVSEQAGAARRGQAIARIYSAASAGELAGPVISGFLFERVGAQFGFSPYFWLAAMFGGVLTLGLVRHRGDVAPSSERDPARAGENPAPRRENGWTPVVASGALSWLLVTIYASMLLFTPLMLARRLGFGPAEIGLVFMGWNGVMLVSQMVAGKWGDHAGWQRPLWVGLVVLVGGLVGLSVLDGTGWTVGMLYLAAVGIGLGSTVVTAYFSGAWEARRPAGTGLGMAFGVANTIWSLGFLAGNTIGGWLLTHFGMEQIFGGLAGLLAPFWIGVGLLMWVRQRKIVSNL
ncbi:MAG: tetracycline resistance MFS efflux pump [Anaerolineales bacterium]